MKKRETKTTLKLSSEIVRSIELDALVTAAGGRSGTKSIGLGGCASSNCTVLC